MLIVSFATDQAETKDVLDDKLAAKIFGSWDAVVSRFFPIGEELFCADSLCFFVEFFVFVIAYRAGLETNVSSAW